MRAAKVQASLRIRAVSPEPSLLAHISSESRGTFRQKARSVVPLNGWACAVKICHDGMLEDKKLLDGAHVIIKSTLHSVSKKVHLSCSGWNKIASYLPIIVFRQKCCSIHTIFFYYFVLIWNNRHPCCLNLQIFVNWNACTYVCLIRG